MASASEAKKTAKPFLLPVGTKVYVSPRVMTDAYDAGGKLGPVGSGRYKSVMFISEHIGIHYLHLRGEAYYHLTEQPITEQSSGQHFYVEPQDVCTSPLFHIGNPCIFCGQDIPATPEPEEQAV